MADSIEDQLDRLCKLGLIKKVIFYHIPVYDKNGVFLNKFIRTKKDSLLYKKFFESDFKEGNHKLIIDK
jgi:hypothetical protein